jgi:hypothetical protein
VSTQYLFSTLGFALKRPGVHAGCCVCNITAVLSHQKWWCLSAVEVVVSAVGVLLVVVSEAVVVVLLVVVSEAVVVVLLVVVSEPVVVVLLVVVSEAVVVVLLVVVSEAVVVVLLVVVSEAVVVVLLVVVSEAVVVVLLLRWMRGCSGDYHCRRRKQRQQQQVSPRRGADRSVDCCIETGKPSITLVVRYACTVSTPTCSEDSVRVTAEQRRSEEYDENKGDVCVHACTLAKSTGLRRGLESERE